MFTSNSLRLCTNTSSHSPAVLLFCYACCYTGSLCTFISASPQLFWTCRQCFRDLLQNMEWASMHQVTKTSKPREKQSRRRRLRQRANLGLELLRETENTWENTIWSFRFERNGMCPESTVLCLLLSISHWRYAVSLKQLRFCSQATVHECMHYSTQMSNMNDYNSNISGLSNYTSVSFWWWGKETEWWWLFPSAAAVCQTEIPQCLLSNSERVTKVTNENSKVFKESPLHTRGWDDDERASTSGVKKSWLMLVRVL